VGSIGDEWQCQPAAGEKKEKRGEEKKRREKFGHRPLCLPPGERSGRVPPASAKGEKKKKAGQSRTFFSRISEASISSRRNKKGKKEGKGEGGEVCSRWNTPLHPLLFNIGTFLPMKTERKGREEKRGGEKGVA